MEGHRRRLPERSRHRSRSASSFTWPRRSAISSTPVPCTTCSRTWRDWRASRSFCRSLIWPYATACLSFRMSETCARFISICVSHIPPAPSSVHPLVARLDGMSGPDRGWMLCGPGGGRRRDDAQRPGAQGDQQGLTRRFHEIRPNLIQTALEKGPQTPCDVLASTSRSSSALFHGGLAIFGRFHEILGLNPPI